MIRGRAAAIGRAGLRGVRRLLENRHREEVATKADISGRIDNPNVSALDVVIRLVQNAFFKAILPGFDVEIARAGRLKD